MQNYPTKIQREGAEIMPKITGVRGQTKDGTVIEEVADTFNIAMIRAVKKGALIETIREVSYAECGPDAKEDWIALGETNYRTACSEAASKYD